MFDFSAAHVHFLDLTSSDCSRPGLLPVELLKSKKCTCADEKSNICYSEDAWWSGPDRSDVFQDFLDATSKNFPQLSRVLSLLKLKWSAAGEGMI